MLKNGRQPGDGLAYSGCSCCNSVGSRRRAKKSLKSKEKVAVRKLIRQEADQS